MESKRFYSNGKLLLTGEYLVLDGVLALAVPSKFGQDLVVRPHGLAEIQWKSWDVESQLWMCESFATQRLFSADVLAGDSAYLTTLLQILRTAVAANPARISRESGFAVDTHLSFPRLWGLGTSSTLINNIAQWFEIDALELLDNSFGGSGYDIACAQYNAPLMYRRTDASFAVQELKFDSHWCAHLYFVYLNKKQDSKAAIGAYRAKQADLQAVFEEVEQIGLEVATMPEINRLSALLKRHEALIGQLMGLPTVQSLYFSDFPGTVKSLGAWGGDFAMAVSAVNPKAYFAAKGFETVLTYDELLLNGD